MPSNVTTLAADLITPVGAYAAMRAHAPKQPSFLLESVFPGERWGRYSIVGYRALRDAFYSPAFDGLAVLADDLRTLAKQEPAAELAASFADGMVGFVAYDALHPSIGVEAWPDVLALGRMMFGATVAVFDNLRQTVTVAGSSRGAVKRCIWEMSHPPAGSELMPLAAPDPKASPENADVSMSDEVFASKVARAKQYIEAGDAFQIVLARSFTVPMGDIDPFDVYRALRVLSPSPYLFYVDFPDTPLSRGIAIAGASPETMVRVEDRTVTLRPIAGTRPRGANDAEDRALAEALIADPKERAEHVMLIDLARNDVGRVAEPGSVELTANMEIERFSHVMHIVSEVRGKLASDRTSGDAFAAAFPAGTLTGAPKVRAAQIIRELEPRSRGVYGGAVGYALPGGSIDFAIAIRTAFFFEGEGTVTAGAGVVEGSVPEAEADETRNKARAALAAIRAAQDAAVERAALAEARQKKLEERAAAERAAAEQRAAESAEKVESKE